MEHARKDAYLWWGLEHTHPRASPKLESALKCGSVTFDWGMIGEHLNIMDIPANHQTFDSSCSNVRVVKCMPPWLPTQLRELVLFQDNIAQALENNQPLPIDKLSIKNPVFVCTRFGSTTESSGGYCSVLGNFKRTAIACLSVHIDDPVSHQTVRNAIQSYLMGGRFIWKVLPLLKKYLGASIHLFSSYYG